MTYTRHLASTIYILSTPHTKIPITGVRPYSFSVRTPLNLHSKTTSRSQNVLPVKPHHRKRLPLKKCRNSMDFGTQFLNFLRFQCCQWLKFLKFRLAVDEILQVSLISGVLAYPWNLEISAGKIHCSPCCDSSCQNVIFTSSRGVLRGVICDAVQEIDFHWKSVAIPWVFAYSCWNP